MKLESSCYIICTRVINPAHAGIASDWDEAVESADSALGRDVIPLEESSLPLLPHHDFLPYIIPQHLPLSFSPKQPLYIQLPDFNSQLTAQTKFNSTSINPQP